MRSNSDAAARGSASFGTWWRVSAMRVPSSWSKAGSSASSHEPYEAERREQGLVQAFKSHLERRQHDVCRLKIVPPGEAKPLFCDLYDATTGTLVEAKGSVE